METTVVVVRTKTGWPRATGVNDPSGRYYLRHKRGGGRYQYLGSWLTYGEALREKVSADRAIILAPLMKTCEEALKSFIAHLRHPSTKKAKDGRAYRSKAIREREADIREFMGFVKKYQVCDIARTDLLRWRDSLPLHPNTIRSKLSSIVSWHKWLGGDGLVQKGDLPRKRKTRPKPYTTKEMDAMFKSAEGHEHLLLRVALAAGLRKMEMATLESSDVHATAPIITVQESKPHYDWVPKTIQGARDITIDRELWEDLVELPSGLIFPASNGKVNIHIDRIFQAVGLRAGVKTPAGKGWVHRWRHSCATERIRNGEDPVSILAQMGWSDYSMILLYAESDPENPKNLAAAERRARPAKVARPRLVNKTA